MAARTNFQGVKQDGRDEPTKTALTINQTLLGKLNCTLDVTLRASQTTTVIDDPRINTTSLFIFDPRTTNARAALFSMYVSSVSKGSATVTHTNTATVDRTFVVGILA